MMNYAMMQQDQNPSPEIDEPVTTQATSEGAAAVAGETAGDLTQAKLILEAALLSSSEPLQLIDLKKLFDQELSADTIRKLLDELKAEWATRAPRWFASCWNTSR